MNANDAQIMAVYVRQVGQVISDNSIVVSGVGNPQFEVVVEAEAGNILGTSVAPYQLSLTAFDWTTGNAAIPAAAFTFSFNDEAFDPNGPFHPLPRTKLQKWPHYEESFRVTIPVGPAAALVGHVLQYTVVLISPPPASSNPANVVSTAQSPMFVLI